MSAVVDHLRGAHRSACLAVIYAYAVAAAGYILSVDAIAAQRVYCCLSDFMSRQFGYKLCVHTVVGATYSDISLTATEDDFEDVALNESPVSFRRKTEHYLSKGYYTFHSANLSKYLQTS